ncbi:TetR family transcriptional regulator [Herbiconiux sp.]|uniref:TetR family transcriptional regulator n=1 Tax=Herbiconiux sp. TaxID=1871186 RepID=UPI0025BD28BF|nr:TetR family transcriptional regulator [Herbiconiux sp.]
MVRWEPGARDRLRSAAIELFTERGFEAVTAAEIAEASGLTERTFFRHFADKREVLFDGQNFFQTVFVESVAAAPADASPVQTVEFALHTAAASFFPDERRPYSRVRQGIIDANAPLQERESLKMVWLSQGIAEALQARGVPEAQAALAAQSGVTVFGVAFTRWLAPGEQRSLPDLQREVWDELRGVLTP